MISYFFSSIITITETSNHMSYVRIITAGSNEPIEKLITDNPTVLFNINTPIQPTDIQIIYADEDKNVYSVTLYTKDYKIILRYSRTYIFYRKNEIESIQVFMTKDFSQK